MPSLPFFKKGTETHVSKIKDFDLDKDVGASGHHYADKDATFGTSPVIKTFYESRREGNGPSGPNFNWQETPPRQLSAKKALNHDRMAIKVYKIKDYEQKTIGGRTPLKIHMNEIQSPYLTAELKSILEPMGVFLEASETAKFEAPFRPLYFALGDIRALYDKQKASPVLGAHLKLFLSVLSDLFDGFRAQLSNLQASKLISFKLAWTYFPRGSTLYSNAENTERLIRVVDTKHINQKTAF